MTFVSYAENFEDVMLWRALGHESDGSPRFRPGNWIDVGACDPVIDSVTHAFHVRGWRGFNLTLDPDCFPKLSAARPSDVNLHAAAGDFEGTLHVWQHPETDLVTASPLTVERYRRKSRLLKPLDFQVHRLAALCGEHGFTDVDFLRVDCTAIDRSVLAGADLRRLRPSIVLLKTTKSKDSQPEHGAWADLLNQAGYMQAYFDGLNRFYIVEEHRSTLANHFVVPPNVFDAFVRADEEYRYVARQAEQRAVQTERDAARRLLAAEREIGRGERRLALARAAADQALQSRSEAQHQAKQDVAAVEAHVAHLKMLLASTFSSTSWRISRPVRVLARAVKRLRRSETVPQTLGSGALEPGGLPTIPEPVAPVLGLMHLGSREHAAVRRLMREAP